METVRIIVCASKEGRERESITFTSDFDIDGKSFCANAWSVDIDKKIEMEIPLGFPMDFTFER